MIGRKSTIGLALLCAFAFCAFVAQSAMAEKGVHATNTTAVTCVFVGPENGEFEDEHCDVDVGPENGEYEHDEIALNETTELDIVEEGSSKLNGTLAGVATEVTCTQTDDVPGKSFIHNVEENGKHTVTGTVQVEFTNCTVVKPAKCVIKEPVKTTATFEGVEELGPSKDTMGVEFKGHGDKGSFAELFFENKGAEKCALTNGGKAFLVNGTAIGTGTPPPNADHAGATLNFEPNTMETLEIGLKPATFEGTFITSMADGGDPIALTTTT